MSSVSVLLAHIYFISLYEKQLDDHLPEFSYVHSQNV